MTVFLSAIEPLQKTTELTITGSKSESNRLLILQALYPNLTIENLSNSDDTRTLQNALEITQGTVDVHHAGTAMRFLTAYYASQKGKNILLTGSERMQQRPIGVLVDALRDLGAEITYAGEEGYPPLQITGTTLNKKAVSIQADVSSQYISALMLIAPSLSNGLTITLDGEVTSVPYIKMTLSLLNSIGIIGSYSENKITIENHKKANPKTIVVESDWSSASYFYSLVALSGISVELRSYRENSLQGDAALAELYEPLGVETQFNAKNNSITLSSNNNPRAEHLMLHLADTPDIAQTIAVTCFGLGMGCTLTGLHTLKIKETDRLTALKTELSKLGASISVTSDSLTLKPSEITNEWVMIETYNDHRMAMAFAPLSCKIPIKVNDPDVVSKSYPSFWTDLEKMGIQVRSE